MERKYYKDIGYKPFLFFMVFGVNGGQLEVSRSKHKVDGFPEGLDIVSLNRTEHSEYLDGLLGGDIGKVLKEADSELYETCVKSEDVAVIRGQIEDDSTLDYMINVIGIIEAFIDKGAVGVLDLPTFTMYSPKKWTERFFDKEVNAQNHVLIMFSDDDDGCWIHTRGMCEFGRPDIGISNVPEDKIEDYKQVVDQMIFYGGQGLFFEDKVKLHTYNGKTFLVDPEFVDDFDNDDYNNAYYDVTVIEEIE